MSHGAVCHIDVDAMLEEKPLELSRMTWKIFLFFALAGLVVFLGEYFEQPLRAPLWCIFYLNLIFWMGIAAGGVVAAAVFQIVRAQWSPPVRRIAEANIAFLPVALILLMLTWFGRAELFPWVREKLPGLEWWMKPEFVYLRFTALFLILFGLMFRFVGLSLRGDIGLLRERKPGSEIWGRKFYDLLVRGWQGSKSEGPVLQRKMSTLAPIVAVVYAVVFSLFAFEMVKGMVAEWPSTLFGAHIFVGNIYVTWAFLGLLVIYLARSFPSYERILETQQLWDLGKLALGFSMVWADFMFCQFLTQWYGNLPSETHWMVLRVRMEPWKWLCWLMFSLCFLIPFILLLSRDLKRNPRTFFITCLLIVAGMWIEKYLMVIPVISPGRLLLASHEVFVTLMITLGFFGTYMLCLHAFLRRFPFVPLSHPLTGGLPQVD